MQRLKKKIVLLSSKGGYGHEAASLAIREIGADLYDFEEVFPIERLNRFGTQSGENLYNSLLQHDWIRTTNFLSNQLAPLLFYARRGAVKSLMQEYLSALKPDLVLSLIPFINAEAAKITQDQGIPYLLVSTDNDLRHWVLGLDSVRKDNFSVTIGKEGALTSELLKQKGVEEEKIHLTGLPIHPSFLKRKEGVREDLGLPLNKPIVVVMMGGAGGGGVLAYAKALLRLSMPMHVVLCTGRNEGLYHRLRSFSEIEGHVSFSVLRFTNRVADLLQVADLLITKPGPGSINEALTRGIPLLVDNVHSSLAWERVNLTFIESSQLGRVLSTVEDVQKWVPLYLFDEFYKKQVKQAYAQLKLPFFHEHILRILDSLLGVSV